MPPGLPAGLPGLLGGAAQPYPGATGPGTKPPTPEEDMRIIKEPAIEEVEGLMRMDAARGFRIDVESDSTIRADLGRNQSNMAAFLTASASYWQSVGPLLMKAPQAADAAMELYAAFARNFKLGKQAEDALDRMADDAKKAAAAPPQPTPEQLKMMADAKLKADEIATKEKERQDKANEAAGRLKIDNERLALDGRIAQAEADHRRLDHQQRAAEHQQRVAEFRRQAEERRQEQQNNHALGLRKLDNESQGQIGKFSFDQRKLQSEEATEGRRMEREDKLDSEQSINRGLEQDRAEREFQAKNDQFKVKSDQAASKLILPPGFQRK